MTHTNQFRRGRHCVFALHVHLVFITKYRRQVLTERAHETLRTIFTQPTTWTAFHTTPLAQSQATRRKRTEIFRRTGTDVTGDRPQLKSRGANRPSYEANYAGDKAEMVPVVP